VASRMATHPVGKTGQVRQAGFSLIEMIISLALVGILGVIAGGFILPLRMTGNTSSQTQSLAVARSYLEITKNRWLNKISFENQTLPTLSTVNTSSSDIKLPTGWTVTSDCKGVTNTGCTTTDELRTMKITVTAPNRPALTLTTQISRPSYE
jgi:prepilin-type N-terminal cleavage/methylation domain-containing protein